MHYLIGLDIGTTGAKAVLINPSGEVISSHTAEYSMASPHPLWAEQNPGDWWSASQESLQSVIKKAGITPDKVAGIGLTGQMHGLVLLDGDGNVIRPCIMWNDQRSFGQCERITGQIGLSGVLQITGNAVLPGFTAPKIIWVRENEPENYSKIAHILLPKDYVRYRLTGDFATDVSDASGMSLLDVANRRWSVRMLENLDIPEAWLPKVYESSDITGVIAGSAAEETGLMPGTPVVAGGGDQAAGAVGSGVTEPGRISLVLGTSGVVFAHTDSLFVEPEGRLHAFCHAVPGAWHVMGVTLSAGGSLRWYRDALCEAEKSAQHRGTDVYDELVSSAGSIPAGSEGLIFLPYLSGERTPYPDPDARGVFYGLTQRHTKAHFTRSILEGVAFSLRDCMEIIIENDIPVHQVRVTGGGAKSPEWLRIIASVLHRELATVSSSDGAPFGAALLAGAGSGIYSSIQEACDTAIRIVSRFEPVSADVDTYRKYYNLYRSLYPGLKESFSRLAKIEGR